MKRLLLLALLASVTFAAYPNLQLAYRFQNSALDWSGNGRNGTVNGSGVYTTARGQQALYFDGTGDYVQTPSFGLSGTVVVFAADVRCKFNVTIDQEFVGISQSATQRSALERPKNANSLRIYYTDGTGTLRYPTVSNFFLGYDDVWVSLMVAIDFA